MKLLVIGLGQCGGRIADEFARLNIRAHAQRGTEIIVGAFAANTDIADLSGLNRIKPGYQHRILIGDKKTGGHGVGKINELGAELAKEDGDKILEAIKNSKGFAEADAFLVAAAGGGGTGSGAIPVITQFLKERYIDKPVYDLIVLPFEHEEIAEERTIYNAATCLKSTYLVADAIFLVDNQQYIKKGYSITGNLAYINSLIVEPFFNLLCAGEEKKSKHIGAKMLDAGDIIQTLSGWTAIGYGKVQLSSLRSFFEKAHHFRSKAAETRQGIQALDVALNGLSLNCNPIDAKRALHLVTAPGRQTNVDLIKQFGARMKTIAPEAVIRSGDYPMGRNSIEVTVILSELSDVEKVRHYFTKTIALLSAMKQRQEGIENRQRTLEGTITDIPSLLS